MLDWGCNIAALLLFCFAAFGTDLGLVETSEIRASRLAEEAKVREAADAAQAREREIAREKIESAARRKAEEAVAARKARDAKKREMEAIEDAIAAAEDLPKEERHKQAKELATRMRQFLKDYGETDDNLEWSDRIRSTRLRPLSH